MAGGRRTPRRCISTSARARGKPDGRGGSGFKIIMHNSTASAWHGGSCTAYAASASRSDSLCKERKTFGKPIARTQVIPQAGRMAQKVRRPSDAGNAGGGSGRARARLPKSCMMKNQPTNHGVLRLRGRADFGGAGFMRGVKVERIYRRSRSTHRGGTEESEDPLRGRWGCERCIRGARSREPGSSR